MRQVARGFRRAEMGGTQSAQTRQYRVVPELQFGSWIFKRPGTRSIEDLIYPHGQELAPWRLHQVAVASQGLSPQPLWISAASEAAPKS